MIFGIRCIFRTNYTKQIKKCSPKVAFFLGFERTIAKVVSNRGTIVSVVRVSIVISIRRL